MHAEHLILHEKKAKYILYDIITMVVEHADTFQIFSIFNFKCLEIRNGLTKHKYLRMLAFVPGDFGVFKVFVLPLFVTHVKFWIFSFLYFFFSDYKI